MGFYDVLRDPVGTAFDLAIPDQTYRPGRSIVENHQFIISVVAGGEGSFVALTGSQLPHEILPFGGQQRIVKEFYPGNPEPAMQIMGSEEADIQINGRLYDKRFPERKNRMESVSYEVAKKLDSYRLRGELLELSWGDFRRYGFLKETKFDMKTTKDINYQLIFSILGFSKPVHCKFTEERKVPFEINNQLALEVQDFTSLEGVTLEKGLLDVINDAITTAVDVCNVAIDLVNNTLTQLENIERTYNRAIGAIRNALNSVHRALTRLRRISFQDAQNLTIGLSEFQRPISQSWDTIGKVRITTKQGMRVNNFLLLLLAQIRLIAAQIPRARHLVREGDTLQSLSIKYYGDQTQWNKIKEHNQLIETTLPVGAIIEIPR